MVILGIQRLVEEIFEGVSRYKDYYNILHDSVLAVNAKVIIDLGTFMGLSAEAFAIAAENTGGRVYTIDIATEDDPVRKEQYHESRKRLQWRENVELIQGDSIVVGEGWSNGDVDIVFCDSDHAYERVSGELTTWGRYNPKCVFIHDTVKSEGSFDYPYYAAKDYADRHSKAFFNFGPDICNPGMAVIVMEEG